MKKIASCFIAGLLFCSVALVINAAEVAVDESLEPKAVYNLEINGQKYEINQGQELEVKGEFKDPKIRFEVEPYKEFTYGGIYLKYPQNFSFEADLADENVKMWNLSGNSGILMLQKYSLEMDHRTMANLLQPRYGEENARVAPCTLKFGDKEVEGSKVVATFGGSAISQEVYSFKQGEGSLLMILQDSVDANGNPTAEGLALKKLVGETFKLK